MPIPKRSFIKSNFNSALTEKIYSRDSIFSTAVYSKCEKYRYCLSRTWSKKNQNLLYIMLNPSEATEVKNDPTVQRCQNRAVSMNFSALRVCNLFALRSKDPKLLSVHDQPVGGFNDYLVADSIKWATQIICAWGAKGCLLNRDKAIISTLKLVRKPIYNLGLTKLGQPRHPLYVSYQIKPTKWF